VSFRRCASVEHFAPVPLPPGVPRGKTGKCSVNAMAVAAMHGLQLVRGYALRPNSHWVGHWWAATPDDAVIEVTWEEPGVAYIGERIDWQVVAVDDEGKPTWSAFTRDGRLIEDLGRLRRRAARRRERAEFEAHRLDARARVMEVGVARPRRRLPASDGIGEIAGSYVVPTNRRS
jgi:hypothetical protein